MKNGLFSFLLLGSTPLFAADAGSGRQGNLIQTFIMIGIAILFFYFILWRPEQKRRKKLEAQRGSMKKGDRVIAMGLVGTIDKIEEKTVILKSVDGSKFEVVKGAISEVQPSSSVEKVDDAKDK